MFTGLRFPSAFAAAVGVGLALCASLPHRAEAAVTIGTLTCNVQGGYGFIFGSSRAVNCTFAGPGARYERYVGNIAKFGVDIGYTQGGILVWTVVAPSAEVGTGELAGQYIGGTASATLGIGAGANALVGGSRQSFALQPLSIETNRGLNIAAGIAEMTLTPAP